MAKRNANGSGSIRLRSDGRWEARYTAGRNPKTGKQVQKCIYGKTQNEVRQKLNAITVSIDEGTYIEPSRMLAKEWFSIWIEQYVANTVKASTLYSYTRICNKYIIPHIGALRLLVLTPHAIQMMLNALHKDAGNGSGLSPKSIKNVHGVLHKALQQAVIVNYIRVNPADACTLPRIVKKDMATLDRSQISLFIDAIKGHEFEPLFLFTLFTGVRQSEAIGLRWGCINFDAGKVSINAQLLKNYSNSTYYIDTPKSDKASYITPASFVMDVLQKLKAQQNMQRQFAGLAWNDNDFVFTNALGEHLKHVTVYKHFKRIMSVIGLPGVRFHDLRHSYAVSALQAGDDVKTVQENLGHHTAAYTLDAYGHVTDEMKRESAARMDAFINGIHAS